MAKKLKTCYYQWVGCIGPLWTCATCGECFCKTHSHTTSLGRNIECRACEYARQDTGRLNATDEQIERRAKQADPGDKLS